MRLHSVAGIRLAAIDAPELAGSPKCHPVRASAWCDNAATIAARDSLSAFLVRGAVTVQRTGINRYGRTLARVTVNGCGAIQRAVLRGFAARQAQ